MAIFIKYNLQSYLEVNLNELLDDTMCVVTRCFWQSPYRHFLVVDFINIPNVNINIIKLETKVLSIPSFILFQAAAAAPAKLSSPVRLCASSQRQQPTRLELAKRETSMGRK